jgi:hypothetical protein
MTATREYLSFQDIEREYVGTVKAHTLSVWLSTNRYGFRGLVTRVGGKPRVRRDRWEDFLDQRTGEAA